MIYFLFLLMTLYGIIQYDFYKSAVNTLYPIHMFSWRKKRLFYFLLIYMVLYTGFSYRVGTDVGRYIYEFEWIGWSDLNFDNLSLSHRQPMWMFIQLVSKSILNSFVFFRVISSFVVTFCIFKYIERQTPFVFTAILFYFILMSFDVNFNILRQSMAIACFVLSCSFLKNGDLLYSYLFIFMAIMFHNSAFVLLIIPLIKFINVKSYFNASYIFMSIICLLILFIPKDNILFNYLMNSSDDSLSSLSQIYLDSEYGHSGFSLLKIIIYLCIFYFMASYYKLSGASNIDIALFYIYIVCFISSASIPIIGRIKYYFTIFYILAACNAIFYFVNNNKSFVRLGRSVLYVILLLILLYSPVKYYFILNPRVGIRNGAQYYPYYSVFNPQLFPERESVVDY